MLELLEKELRDEGIFDNQLPPILGEMVKSIDNNMVPYRMKLTLAVSELMLFASHLRRNINHWNGSIIPINTITFSVAASGFGKDSSVNALRKCFKDGYAILDKKRKAIATQRAINLAKLEGKPNYDEWATYKEFYIKPNPLFVAPSTPEGFIQHLNDLDEAGTGAGFIYSGEFGAELANSPVIIENIKLLAEMYDEGSKEVKILKSRENQSKEIKNLPVSALFVGSQDNLLFNESIKALFKREFSTKLARRSFFNFSPEVIKPLDYSNGDDMIEAEIASEEAAKEARAIVNDKVADITKTNMETVGTALDVDPEVRRLFLKYKRYNFEKSELIKSMYPIAKITRTHLQWKALKLAGAIAIFNEHNAITKADYTAAIGFVELLDKDMQMFEAELVKEPYENFCDFMHAHAENNKYNIGLHTLKKLGYIPNTGNPTTKMKDLVHLAASYDPNGIYTVCEEGICYEEIVKTTVAGVSYVEVDNSGVIDAIANGASKDRVTEEKGKVGASADTGFQFYETYFEELGSMLYEDFAYSPFRFKDGKRGKDNIITGCKWVVLDVDTSSITDTEAHLLLSDINHHIARTSDKNNPFKFRIILELDSIVDISNQQWRFFIQSIASDLAITCDNLPKSQIYFSYAGEGREVLSVLDAEPLSPKQHIIFASEAGANADNKTKSLSTKEQKTLLADELTTFEQAFNAENGAGSRKLIWAAKYAKELGMGNDEIEGLIHRINNYWLESMSEDRLEATIFSQTRRW